MRTYQFEVYSRDWYKVLRRVAILLNFVILGAAGIADTTGQGAFKLLREWLNIDVFGFLMLGCALLVAYETLTVKRLTVFSILPFFGYVGAVFGLAVLQSTVPLQTIGVYILAAVVVLVEAVEDWRVPPNGSRSR